MFLNLTKISFGHLLIPCTKTETIEKLINSILYCDKDDGIPVNRLFRKVNEVS